MVLKRHPPSTLRSHFHSIRAALPPAMAAFFASLPDTNEGHRRLVVRYLDRNCADACFLPSVGFGGTMKIQPSFQNQRD